MASAGQYSGRMLCLDAGQTGCRAMLADAPEHVVELEPLVTDRPVLEQLADRVRAGLAALGPARVVAIGSSGLPGVGAAAGADGAAGLLLLLAGGVRRLLLTHDSITNYLAVLGSRSGVVVAAGTGVVTLAVGDASVARVDGWGYLVGDAGSGYWVGRAGLDAVLRAFDGRGPATALSAVVRNDFPDLAEMYLELQGDDAKVSRIAGYARAVADLAGTDEVCRAICRSAAGELAHSVLTGIRRVSLASPVTVGLSGRLLGSEVLRREVIRLVSEAHPDAQFVTGTGGSLAGVALLPTLPANSVLSTWVDAAAV